MDSKIDLKEILFVLPLSIIINILLIRIFKIENLMIQALMIAVLYIVFMIVYRGIIKFKNKQNL